MRRPGRRSPAAGAAVAGRGDEGRAARGEPRVEEGLPRARRAGGGGRWRRHVAGADWRGGGARTCPAGRTMPGAAETNFRVSGEKEIRISEGVYL